MLTREDQDRIENRMNEIQGEMKNLTHPAVVVEALRKAGMTIVTKDGEYVCVSMDDLMEVLMKFM
jgi:hypothetical protein